MTLTLIRNARRLEGIIGIALLSVLVGFSLFSHLAPLTGHELFVIVGGSMEPTIPIGSLVVTNRTDAAAIVTGDVITIRADNGVIVTHRVSRIVDGSDGRSFETTGDANDDPDGGLVPSRALVGVVALHVPFGGYARAFLGTGMGMIAAVAALGFLYLANRLLQLLETAVLTARARTPIPS